MNRVVICLVMLVCSANSDQCWSQISTFKEWDQRAIKVFQENESRVAIDAKLQKLLDSQSLGFLVGVLSQPDFPALRIAAFHAIKSKRPELELEHLLLLLADSHQSFSLYEPEFELLNRLTKAKGPSAEMARFMSWNFEGDRRSVLTIVLRAIPTDQLLPLLENREVSPIIPVSNLAAILDRLCGAFPKWRETEMSTKIISALQAIKNSPGYSQVTILEHFPFQEDAEAIEHIRFLFEDETLPDPVVVLSARRFQKLVLSSQAELVAGKNTELVRRRIGEFKKRIVRDDRKERR